MKTAIIQMTDSITKKFDFEIGRLAFEALLYEVSVTPKPGLVDRENSGAHDDMNYFTFMSSASSLCLCFHEFARKGAELAAEKIPVEKFLAEIRPIGVKFERLMFAATHGINTHKGEIFSLGLLSACAGYLASRSSSEILDFASKVCAGICERDFADIASKKILTKGEKLYMKYGITGIRGEAEAGYPCVREALPVLRKLLARNFCMNDALAVTLLKIISINTDTNIISRHNFEVLNRVQIFANAYLELILDYDDDHVAMLRRLDRKFIEANISPSGSADLLAVTYFMHAIENLEI